MTKVAALSVLLLSASLLSSALASDMLRVSLSRYREPAQAAPARPPVSPVSISRDIIADPTGLYVVCVDTQFPSDILCDLSLLARSEMWTETRKTVEHMMVYYSHPNGELETRQHCGLYAERDPVPSRKKQLSCRRIYCNPALGNGTRPVLSMSGVYRVVFSIAKRSAKRCDMSFNYAGVIRDRPGEGTLPLVKFLYAGGDCDVEKEGEGGEEEGGAEDQGHAAAHPSVKPSMVMGKFQMVTHLGRAYPDY